MSNQRRSCQTTARSSAAPALESIQRYYTYATPNSHHVWEERRPQDAACRRGRQLDHGTAADAALRAAQGRKARSLRQALCARLPPAC